MKHIDIKSALVGALLVISITLLVAAAQKWTPKFGQ